MKYLIVANQTLGGGELADLVRSRAEQGAGFHVVVPASAPAGEHGSGNGNGNGDARAASEERLQQALSRYEALGASVTGEVTDADPLHAIEHALAKERFGGIIISTLPAGISRWLRMDLPHRADRKFELPVIWIEATA